MSDIQSSNRHDDTLQAINQILPEIQQQLMEQLRHEIQQQMNKQLERQIIQVEAQAELQFMRVIQSLNEEKQKLQEQKVAPIYLKIVDLETQAKERQIRQFSQLQDKFLLSQFDQKILKHPNIEMLQIQIEQQLFENEDIASRFEANKVRRLKEISIQIEQRQEKFKRQKDKAIRKKQYAQSGIQQLKKDIEVFSVRIAQLKSEYNIKIRKIDSEIKADKSKCRQFQSRQDLTELKGRLQYLRKINAEQQQMKHMKVKGVQMVQMQDETQKSESEYDEQENAIYNYSCNQDSKGLSESNFDTFNRQNKKFPEQNKSHKLSKLQKDQIIQSISSNGLAQRNNFYQEEVVIESSSQQPQEMQQKYQRPKEGLIKRLKRNNNNQLLETNFQGVMNCKDYKESNRVFDSSRFDQSDGNVSRGPIIDLDVSKLLRERWQDDSSLDPLGKYLSKGSINDQNNSNLQNCGKSDFYEQYQNYLKKLGGVSQKSYQYIQSQKGRNRQFKAPRKLSQQAKSILIKKIATSGFSYA